MSQEPPAGASPRADIKDRHVGLVVFGILSIFIGCICALFVALMFLGQALAARTTGEPTDYRMILPSVMTYAVMAVAFVWLGIGSIRARRWARALLLVLAWMWLLLGIFTTGLVAVLLPQLLETAGSPAAGQPLPHAARVAIAVFVLAFVVVVFVGLPAAFILFYRSRHVKATCEARDPVPRWTDACPLPVLALSVALAFTPLSVAMMMVAYNSVVPFFGLLVTGPPAAALAAAGAAACGYGAWATYKLKPLGWWVITVTFVFFSLSSVLTFARVDLVDLYRAMGYTPQQIELVRAYPFVQGRTLTAIVATMTVPFVAYLFWMKRYFR